MKNTVTISIEEYDKLRNFKKSILDGKHVVVNRTSGAATCWDEYDFYPPDELIDEFNNQLNASKNEFNNQLNKEREENKALREKNEQLLESIGEYRREARHVISLFRNLSLWKLIEQRRYFRKHPEKYAEL